MSIVFQPLRNIYQSEAKAEVAKHASLPRSILSPEAIDHLPEPVRKYFTYCGYLGREQLINASITWKDVLFRSEPGKNWMHIDYQQFNSAPEPVRLAYIYSSMMGMLPFEGYDKYKDGHGSMQIRLLKLLRIAEYKGREMDTSALVTILSESAFLPAYALQEYVTWKPVNDQTAVARLHYNAIPVEGTFYFSNEGLLTRFETNDRYYALEGQQYQQFPWSVTIDGYQDMDGLKYPLGGTATWHLPDGDYEYFKGTIQEVRFNEKS